MVLKDPSISIVYIYAIQIQKRGEGYKCKERKINEIDLGDRIKLLPLLSFRETEQGLKLLLRRLQSSNTCFGRYPKSTHMYDIILNGRQRT